jgi:hypothetical protein
MDSVRFAERRNPVSARAQSRFKRGLPPRRSQAQNSIRDGLSVCLCPCIFWTLEGGQIWECHRVGRPTVWVFSPPAPGFQTSAFPRFAILFTPCYQHYPDECCGHGLRLAVNYGLNGVSFLVDLTVQIVPISGTWCFIKLRAWQISKEQFCTVLPTSFYVLT